MNENKVDNKKDAKRRDQPPFFIWESIMNTPKILGECLTGFTYDQVNNVSKKCKQKNVDKIFLVGTAASYFATIAEKPAFEVYAGLLTANYLVTEFLEYPPVNLDEHSAVFLHSHSGGTKGFPEIVQKVHDLGGYTVAVTDNKDSTLAMIAEDSIIGPGGSKVELPATRTLSAAIFRMIQLAIELGKGTPFENKAVEGDKCLKKIPDILGVVAQNFAIKAPEIVDVLKNCRSFFIVSSGPNFATANEIAMSFSQSSGLPSQAFQLENFLNGAIQTLRPDMGVILIAASGPLKERILKTAKACMIIGAKVVLLLPEDLDHEVACDVRMDFPLNVTELLSPLIYITPLLQVAYYFSLLGKGCHPDRLSMDKPEFIQAFSALK
jgi:glucosamine 6-phosphate synthetase-like amidotransferase/phosphosugar isomerase protein